MLFVCLLHVFTPWPYKISIIILMYIYNLHCTGREGTWMSDWAESTPKTSQTHLFGNLADRVRPMDVAGRLLLHMGQSLRQTPQVTCADSFGICDGGPIAHSPWHSINSHRVLLKPQWSKQREKSRVIWPYSWFCNSEDGEHPLFFLMGGAN